MTNEAKTATMVAKSVTIPVAYKSVADIGYNAAKYADTGSVLVKALIDANIGWPNDVSDDNMALLKSGMVLRKQEITVPTWFRVEGKNLIRLDDVPTKAQLSDTKLQFLKLDVNYAMSFTPHQLGALKDQRPAEYEQLVAVRTQVSKYVSNVLGRLRSMTKALKEPDSKQRGATKPIREKVETFFKDLISSNKLARDNRGDPTAFADAVLDRKIHAFWTTE